MFDNGDGMSDRQTFHEEVRSYFDRSTVTTRRVPRRRSKPTQDLLAYELYIAKATLSRKLRSVYPVTEQDVRGIGATLIYWKRITRRSQLHRLFSLGGYPLSEDEWHEEPWDSLIDDTPPEEVGQQAGLGSLKHDLALPPETSERNNLPFPPNPFFTGREAYLERLEQFLNERGSVASTQPLILTGLGGIGKTQVALTYAHSHYPKTYRTVLWVNAVEKETIEASCLALARLLELPVQQERDTDRIVQAVKQWLERHANWLLIMDNADDLPLARSFLPGNHHGHILLTTRSQIVGTVGTSIELSVMEPSEALQFLLRRAKVLAIGGSLDDIEASIRKAAARLVHLLGALPLALDQAGAYIDAAGKTFREYIPLYHEKRRELLLKRGPLSSEHPESVAVTFKLCFDMTSEIHPLTRDILHFCAFLHPDAIPKALLEAADRFKLDTIAFDDGIAALRQYSLITYHAPQRPYAKHVQTFSIHRLVQDVLVDSMDADAQHLWRAVVVTALLAAFPPVAAMDWGHYERLPPHVLICARWTDEEIVRTIEFAELLRTAAQCLQGEGRSAEAETLLAQALSIFVQQRGYEHPATMTILAELGSLYILQGKDDQAEALYYQALGIQGQPLEVEQPATARCLRNLSLLYVKQGKYEQSMSVLGRAVSIQEKYLGPDDPDTAKSLCMLAVLFYAQGDYAQANVLYWRTIRVWDTHSFSERTVQIPLDGLSLLDHEQVQHAQVPILFERALSVYIQTAEGMRQAIKAIKLFHGDPPKNL
jgi:tetratricopeptide (TPR) repeat protein